MLALILAQIATGHAAVVIDPKGDLVREVLARIPSHRQNDVVVLDPNDRCPVGLNPFCAGHHQSPALIADGILAVFQQLFATAWGPRTQDILNSSLLTLAQHDGATLTMLPALLTDPAFRRRMIRKLHDPIGLGPFWAAYEAMSAEQRAQVIAPVMNKLRQFLLRPALRAVLGQAAPRFRLADVFHHRRILLVSLNKGLIGAESARLLGALVVAGLWPLVLARAALRPELRHPVGVYIDEVQDYLALPGDLADALAQARGLGVGFTVAHQYRAQLPPLLRAAIDANVHNRIVFGLGAADARELATQAPHVGPADFMLLPRYNIYAQLQHRGRATGWFSARTLDPPAERNDPAELRALSSCRYGQPAAATEQALLRVIGAASPNDLLMPPGDNEPIGRRPLQTPPEALPKDAPDGQEQP